MTTGLKFVVAHSNPDVGVFAGAMDGGLIWTRAAPQGFAVQAAVCFLSIADAHTVITEMADAGIPGAFAAPVVPDVACPVDGEFKYAGPVAVVAALGVEYGWINERTICYGNC